MPRDAEPLAFVDAHVHFHRGWRESVFFGSAAQNFRFAAASLQASPSAPFSGWLLLTESAGANHFERWRDTAPATDEWSFEATSERLSLVACRDDDTRLLLVAGRQIVTREGVEILALGAEDSIADGGALDVTLERVKQLGALAVLPWGFGKWFARRGRLVRRLVDTPSKSFCLGDNGGRLARIGEPALFARARAVSRWILPGSDPLPFERHQRRAGSCGFALRGKPDAARPAAWLLEAIGRLTDQPQRFGSLAGPANFCRDQIAMQLRKRFG